MIAIEYQLISKAILVIQYFNRQASISNMGQAPSKSVHPLLINYTTCHFNRASGMIEYTNARIDMRGISRQSVRESCFSAGLPIETAESVACVLSRALDTKSDQQIVSKAIIHKIQQYTLSTHGISGHLIQNLWAILNWTLSGQTR